MSLKVFEIHPQRMISSGDFLCTEVNKDLLDLVTARSLIYKQKIAEIVKKLNWHHFDDMVLTFDSRAATIPSMTSFSNRRFEIRLPYLFLIKSEDIPPKLKDSNGIVPPEKWEELFHWTKQFLKQGQEPFNWINRHAIGFFANLASHGEKFELAKEFVLGHEITHAVKKHVTCIVFSKSRALSLLFSFAMLRLSGYYPSRKYMKCVIASLAILNMIRIFYNSYVEAKKSQAQEKSADLTYSALAPSARLGGIFSFTCLMNLQKRMRTISFLGKILFDNEGNNRVHTITHGTEQTRTDHLLSLKS